MNARGRFIVLEGLDGAGKSSCVEYLKGRLGADVVFTHEPGGTSVGEELRARLKQEPLDPLTQLFFFAADRREHMARVIIPALDAGKHVVCDRFMGSSYAYQIVAGGLEREEDLFWRMHDSILGDHAPDHHVFVEVSPEKARERLMRRHMDRFEERLAFQEKVREGYERFFTKAPATRIDGSAELSVMQARCLEVVKGLLAA